MLKILICVLSGVFVWSSMTVQAQEKKKDEWITVKGTVYRADTHESLPNVQVMSSSAAKSVITKATGKFTIKLQREKALLVVQKEGFVEQRVPLYGRRELKIYLQPKEGMFYAGQYVTPVGERMLMEKNSTASAIGRGQLSSGYTGLDDALTGRLAGLRVLNKSGMPGEGSLLNLNGIRSFEGENTPLIVIDGMPYLPDQELSFAINGYSRNVMLPVNLKEVERVTLLRGADAAAYGSLGSNGVLMIETEKGLDMETKVEFQTVEGVGFVNKRIPMLNASNFKNYISDIGSSRYPDPLELEQRFPFLKDDPKGLATYMYRENTDWQDEIFTPAFLSENMLKVKGGDAVVKFMLTAGYQNSKGVIDQTDQSKFFTRVNTDIKFTEKLKTTASVAFNYTQLGLQEQGMSTETNPLLAAYAQSPLIGPYKKDRRGETLPDFTEVDSLWGLSNPKALVRGVEAKNTIYDILVNFGVTWQVSPSFYLDGFFGLSYNYVKEDMFIGGKSNHAIAPLLGGLAENTVRSGSIEGLNYYFRGSAAYNRILNDIHQLRFLAAWQLISSRRETDCGSGINTSSDKYKNLTNVNKNMGRASTGYINLWSWMNGYISADYTLNNQYFLSAMAIVDAASSYGSADERWHVYPAVKAGWQLKNAPFLRDVDAIAGFTLRAEYGINPNSRFDARYGSYYYVQQGVRDVNGLVRAGIPNRKIGPEEVTNTAIGMDFLTRGNGFTFSVDLFEEYTRKMLVGRTISPVYGFNTFPDNDGELQTRGVQFSVSLGLFNRGNFRWRIGGNMTHYNTKIKRLGGVNEQEIVLDDQVVLLSRVGGTPYAFFGNRSKGVFATTEEAGQSHLKTGGGYVFQGGDVHFTDKDGNEVIDSDDREMLGNANPDFFGGFYSSMSYKGFSLFLNFTYSYGNDIYNGVRRFNESMENFSNQANSVSRRWVVEGQQTDMPRTTFGDPAGNNRFSSRWIEDGSFLKLKEVTLSYETRKKFFFLTGAKVFITGENLLTFTDYTGMDPEFSYSYDQQLWGMDMGKVPLPKTVKVGLILNF